MLTFRFGICKSSPFGNDSYLALQVSIKYLALLLAFRKAKFQIKLLISMKQFVQKRKMIYRYK
jgi:hypothetical protein